MEFLLDALRKNRRRVRLEQLLLLLFRIALMVLIALFLARPLLSDRGHGWLASALMSEEKIFVVDDSLSMRQIDTDRHLLSRATTALSGSLERLADRRSRDRITILRSSRPDAPLVRAGFVERDQAALLAQTLATLAPTSTRVNVDRALESVALLTAATTSDSPERPRVVSILTDLRATDWTDGSGGANASVEAALERLGGNKDLPTRIIVVDVGSENMSNVAVTGVDIDGGRPTVDRDTEVKVEVANFGRQPVRNLRVHVTYGPVTEARSAASTVLAPVVREIKPGETVVAGVRCTFRSSGQYWATAEVSGSKDSLQPDNRLSFVLDVVESTELLLINGEPSSEPFEDETDYLAKALRPGGEVSSGLTPLVVVEDSLPRALAQFGAVFLANVYSLPDDFLNRLGRYVRGGGTLVAFLGDQIDPVIYSRALGTAMGPEDDENPARGLLPATIGKLKIQDELPVTVNLSYEHPYFQFLQNAGERYVQQVTFSRYFELEPLPETRVLARFSDSENHPAIVEAGAGAGRVILIASTADVEWNDWPRNPTYLLILQELMTNLAHGRGLEPSHRAGARIEIPLDITTHQNEVRYRGPEYPRTPERVLIASPGSTEEGAAGDFRITVEDTLQDGLSFLTLRSRDGVEETRALAVRSEPAESDLRRVTPDELRRLYPEIPLTVVRDTEGFSDVGRGQFEISDLLIALFLALLFVEGFLAYWFAHHRRESTELGNPGREARRNE